MGEHDNTWGNEAALRSLLEIITRAQSRFVLHGDSTLVFENLLGSLLELTNSRYGFIGEVLVDAEGSFLRTHAITDIAWDEASREFFEANRDDGLEFRNLDTLFGEVIKTGRIVLANDPAAHPASAGLPDGHPKMETFLGMPFFSGNLLIGVVGVANRPGGYDQELVEFLEPFLMTCSSLVIAHRTETEYDRALTAQRELEARARAILESTVDGIFVIDDRGTIKIANPSMAEMFGYEAGSLVGQNVEVLIEPAMRAAHRDLLERHTAARAGAVDLSDRNVVGVRSDGAKIDCDIGISQLTIDGESTWVAVVRDVSARKANEARLEHLNRELETRVEELDRLGRDNDLLADFASFLAAATNEAEAQQAVAVFGGRLFANASGTLYDLAADGGARRLGGWQDGHVETAFARRTCWAVRRGEPHLVDADRRRLACRHTHLGEDENTLCVPVLTQDGPVALLHLRWTGAGAEEARRVAVLAPAMAERLGASLANIRMRLRLQEDSLRDPLTKLSNRRYLEAWLPRELADHRRTHSPLSIAIVDIDHFKKFNDTYGHEIGDEVLRHVARFFTHQVRPNDLVCRLGGEEFLIGLPNTPLEASRSLLDRVRTDLATARLDTPKGEVGVTVSIGVSSFPHHGVDADGLIREADRALYVSKANGRNQVTDAGDTALTLAS